MDGTPCLLGFATVLKQFHEEFTRQLLQLVGQYLRSVVEAGKPLGGDVGPDAATMIVALQWLLLFGAIPHQVL